MIRNWRKAWSLLKTAAKAWIDDDAPSLGAALSYYSVFSLAPLLLLVISVAGLVFGEEAARGALFGQLAGLMGSDAAQAIEGMLAGVDRPSKGIVGTIVGGVVLLVGATTVFAALQNALDRIWQAPAVERGGLWRMLRTRFLSFGLILGIGFLLIVSLVLSAVIAAFGSWWGGAFPGWELLVQGVNLVFGFLMTTVAFAMIYKLMPRVPVRWRDVWLGAAVTALLFNIGRLAIGLYIGKSEVASGFGAAGSLIIVFVWVYYSAQIFLMGAEFTWAYARTHGSLRQAAGAAAGADKSVPPGTARGVGVPPSALAPVTVQRPATVPASRAVGSRGRSAVAPRRLAGWAPIGLAAALGAAVWHVLQPRLLRR